MENEENKVKVEQEIILKMNSQNEKLQDLVSSAYTKIEDLLKTNEDLRKTISMLRTEKELLLENLKNEIYEKTVITHQQSDVDNKEVKILKQNLEIEKKQIDNLKAQLSDAKKEYEILENLNFELTKKIKATENEANKKILLLTEEKMKIAEENKLLKQKLGKKCEIH